MSHIENLTRYTASFVDELVCSGLTHVVVSPGSRSTPLAVLCAEHQRIKEWVIIDERSAAYFALGIAKQTNKPVALVCTSGTAAANYFPAIVEAYYARVPLIVLTADRPHELRGVGASQTITQINMYGQFVKDFQEMALPDRSPEMLRYVRSSAARAVRKAMQGNPGPVHYNFPFREPLMPNVHMDGLWGERTGNCYNSVYDGKKRLQEQQLQLFVQKLATHKKGVIVCGPQVDESLGMHLTALSEQLQIPVLADPLSQLRAGGHGKNTIISTYDAMLRSKELRAKLTPDYIIRFGAMPISKNYLFYLEEHEDVLQIVVEDNESMREPTNHHSEYIFADGSLLCKDVLPLFRQVKRDDTWLSKWRKLNEIVMEELEDREADALLTEGKAVQHVLQMIPNESVIFVANSMPVRDLDTFFTPNDKQMTVHANRGVSGIDGTVSSALGVAATTDKHVTLIVGDLSFYHDLNSLLVAKQYKIRLTILLINNNGGGIFSFLPQANEKKHFEALFGTPLNIDFEKAVSMYGGSYELVLNHASLEAALQKAYKISGLSVIEVQTDRAENVAWHRELFGKIEQRLLKNE